MRAYRVSFNAKTSKWVIEMMGLNLVFKSGFADI